MREHHARWNKGLLKETDSSVHKQSESLTNHWESYPHPNLGKTGRELSNETKLKMSLARRGNKNANWRGGLTELVKGIRRSPEFYQWRKAVLQRDNYVCQDCGAIDNLEAHHIRSIIDYPESIFEFENGLTLCGDCHNKHTWWQRIRPKRERGKIKSKKHK